MHVRGHGLLLVRPYLLPLAWLGCAWLNINSGFWSFRNTSTPFALFHAFRASMPYLLLPVGIYAWLQAPALRRKQNPVTWLGAYGSIALFASVMSPSFEPAFYFGAAYLVSVFIPCAFFSKRRLWKVGRPEVVLLCVTWLVLAVCVAALTAVLREQLASGYGVYGQYKDGVGGMAMSRSSGLARFYGVLALLTFARIWQGRGVARWLLVLPFVLCLAVVWVMQSRGGMFAFVAGLLLLLFLSRASWRAHLLVVLVASVILLSEQDDVLAQRVIDHVRRGQDVEELASMTGRTRAYRKAIPEILAHPVIGQGNWADRLTVDEHVHNSALQALMNAGVLGGVPYVVSWMVGWGLFFRLYARRQWMLPHDRQLFMEASAVMLFFTVRSIPETTTASFSVDSMVMVPVYLYLFMLHQRMAAAGLLGPVAAQPVQPPVR